MSFLRSLSLSLLVGFFIATSALALPGDLDVSFGGGDGIVTTAPGPYDSAALDVLLQNDGKILVVGNGPEFVVLARYLADGRLDNSFGLGGIVTTPIVWSNYEDIAALQSDGKIVVVGYGADRVVLARYRGDGTPDPDFGSAGIVATAIEADISCMSSLALQADGKIVVAVDRGSDLVVARYTTAGFLDASFGAGGMTSTILGDGYSSGTSIKVQDDGKIVVLGGTSLFTLTRYTSAGDPDATFGVGGMVSTDIDSALWGFGEDVVLQPDGRIITVGFASIGDSVQELQIVLARYHADGSLDPTFGTNGIVMMAGIDAEAYAVALQQDGKVVVAGYADPGFMVARYTPAGNLDASFGNGGYIATSVGGYSWADGVAIQEDGKVVVAGMGSDDSGQERMALVRYEGGSSTTLLPPAGITVPASDPDGNYLLSWHASAGNVTYVVEEATDVTFTSGLRTVYTGTATTVNITGRSLNNTYYYRVKATRDGYPDSVWRSGINGCAVATVSVSAAGPLTIPAADADGDYTVSWGASSAAGVTYVLEERTGVSTYGDYVEIYRGPDLSWPVTGRLTNSSYHYRVKATRPGFIDSGYVYGANSCAVPGEMVAAAPATVSVPRIDSDGTYVVSWAASATPGAIYYIEESTSPEFTAATEYDAGTATSRSFSAKSLGSTYYYRVKAIRDGYLDSDYRTGGNGCTIAPVTPLNDDTEFVRQIYRDLLNREADAGGEAYWVGQLHSGALTRAQVVENYLLSPEFGEKVAPLIRLYSAYFLRIPDYEGLAYWMNEYSSGNRSLGDISGFFAGSPEFQMTYGSLDNGEFVQLVYRNVLGRDPEPEGFEFWTGELDAGNRTRGWVMTGFSESQEYQGLVANPVYVTMTYIGLLRRTPETDGYNYWVNRMDEGASGQALIDLFLASAEYAARFQ